MEIVDGGKEKNTLKVLVKGRMDAVSASEFTEKMSDWIDQGETNFVIDLAELDYISSSGLRSFIIAAKKLEATNGQMVLAGLKDVVKKVFDISGFSSIFQIYESVEAALEQV